MEVRVAFHAMVVNIPYVFDEGIADGNVHSYISIVVSLS